MGPQTDISAARLIDGKHKYQEHGTDSCQARSAKACSLKIWLQVGLSHRCTAALYVHSRAERL